MNIEKIGVFCSSSANLDPLYYEQAELLGKWIGENEKTLIYGGSRCGLMEAVAQGVHKTGKGIIVGVIPKILIDREMVSECVGIKVPTEGLTDRKAWLIKLSDVMVAMPGSVGTLDEAFSVMSENAIGINTKKVIFWNINGFWDGLFSMFEGLKQTGVVNKPLERFYMRADTLEEVIKCIESI